MTRYITRLKFIYHSIYVRVTNITTSLRVTMRKTLIILATALTIISVGYSSDLNGKDYISTDTGTVYKYKTIDENGKLKFFISTTIKSCNEDKSLCHYVSELKDSSNTKVSGTKYDYAYEIREDGSIYTVSPGSEVETKLFPAKIKFGEVEKDHQNIEGRDVTDSSEFKKQIPEINIAGKTYKDCVELDVNSTIKFKDQVIKTESEEFYCKGVGLVKEKLKETHNSDKPMIYTNILTSVKNK